MARTIQGFLWGFLILYVVAGAVALMMATPVGLRLLGLPLDALTFLPAKILGAPWSLLLLVLDDGPVTALAVLGICYGINVGVGLTIARESRS